ncbi:MAG: hypothetical protein FWG50_12460 [Kiritimatiellaeota bacterium]|nr:hypothetical protein [Kiritimatiellota bacterium]
MSDNLTDLNEAGVLRELAAFAPQVRDGFARIGGPSDSVLDAIRAEAAKAAAERRRALRLNVVFRRLAAAAVFALLLGGSFQTYQRYHSNNAREQTLTLLSISLATQDGAYSLSDDTSELAHLLLTMQGLDQESFFSVPDEEAGLLWL